MSAIVRALGVAALMTSFTVGSAVAQGDLIRISHQWRAETDARDRATRVFVEEVGKHAPELRFRIYPGSSLIANPVAQFEALTDGALEMAVYPLVYAVGRVPEFSITILPGLIPSMQAALDLKGSAYHDMLQEIAHENGVHIVTWWWTPGGVATCGREITDPSSVEGLRMRAADPYFEVMLQEAGASVHAMPSTEIYSAMQTGVLDGLLTSSESFVSMRIYELATHATAGGDNEIFLLIQPLIMSKAAWDRLTPEQQDAFEKAAEVSEDFFNNHQFEATAEMVRRFEEAEVEVRSFTDEEYASWVELAQDVAWTRFRENLERGDELIDVVQSALEARE
jgi:TRAP-type transport system periplasmic protein